MSLHRPMTLVAYANGAEGMSLHQKTLFECFSEQSDIMGVMPFETVPGGLYRGERELALPSPSWRAINEPGEKGHGASEEFEERTYIMVGGCEIDHILRKRKGDAEFARQEKMWMKAMARGWTDAFLSRDATFNNKRCFEGLVGRLNNSAAVLGHRQDYSERHFANNWDGMGFVAGGLPLSLQAANMLKAQMDLSAGQPYWIMSPDLKSQIEMSVWCQELNAVRTGIENGIEITRFLGIPILTGYMPGGRDEKVLPFTETPEGGNGASGLPETSSLYLVVIGPDAVHGIQSCPMQMLFTGREYDPEHCHVWETMSLEWDVGIVCPKDSYVGRLSGIRCEPVVKTNLL